MTTHKSNNLNYRILAPIILVLTFLLVIGIYASQKQFDTSLENYVSQRVETVAKEFNREIEHKIHIQESILQLIKKNQSLIRSFSTHNRHALNDIANPIYHTLSKQLNISHLYFSDINRVIYLRAHKTDRYGDTTNRPTTLSAEKSNSLISGIDLGPFGTLTLRSVTPWYDEQENKIGYIELGIDISLLLEEISELNNVNVLLAIEKSNLSRTLWEEGQKLFERSPNWERFNNLVISNEYWINEKLFKEIPNLNQVLKSKSGLGSTHLTSEKDYHWHHIPVDTFGKKKIGQIFIAVDTTDWKSNYQSNAIKAIVLYILISVLLLLGLYRLTNRAQLAEVELQASMQQLNKIASYDQLTQLPNRQLFITELEQRLEESRRFKQKLAVCFIDLDNFKMVNDTMGHEQGDKLLQQVSRNLISNIREYDVLSRFGGDEFVLMMPHTNTSSVVTALEKLLEHCNKPFQLQQGEVYVTLSIGVSIFPEDGSSRDELLRNADAAMYQAKESGKNCFRFFTARMNNELHRQQSIESRLRTAIRNKEFKLFYQPQYEIQSGTLSSCEALLRWFPQDGKMISPAEFIPVAEKSTLIVEIGDWIIEEACRQQQEWKKQNINTRIDINLSGRQLRDRDIYNLLSEKLDQFNLEFSDIGIELTENILINSDEKLINSMNKLLEKGTSIAIDDFGTGYSSLSYLKKFPVTTVKIDQEFVSDAPHDPNDRAIMAAIVAMSHTLGLDVIVEGIETQQHEDIAREIGCEHAQGFYYHKPAPAHQINFQSE